MQINWLWLIIGLVPYALQRQSAKDVQVVRVQAFFWRLVIHWHEERCSWKLFLPVIEHWPHE